MMVKVTYSYDVCVCVCVCVCVVIFCTEEITERPTLPGYCPLA